MGQKSQGFRNQETKMRFCRKYWQKYLEKCLTAKNQLVKETTI